MIKSSVQLLYSFYLILLSRMMAHLHFKSNKQGVLVELSYKEAIKIKYDQQ